VRWSDDWKNDKLASYTPIERLIFTHIFENLLMVLNHFPPKEVRWACERDCSHADTSCCAAPL